MGERETELLGEIVEATVAKGGHVTISGPLLSGDQGHIIEWWCPALVTPSWTQHEHPTLLTALEETAERLGRLTEAEAPS